MPFSSFRIRTVMIAVASVGVWLALSRVGAVLGAIVLGAMQCIYLVELQKWASKRHGVDPTNELTAKVRARLRFAELTLLVVFVPLFVVTIAISRL